MISLGSSAMLHWIPAISLLILSHLVFFFAMTERKYSFKKTMGLYALLYVVFILVIFIGFLLLSNLTDAVVILFPSTFLISFLVFILSSADPFCKKAYLFISYGNIFCILQCAAVIIRTALFPALSPLGVLYARNIIRTLLYIPTLWAYVKFLRPTVREVSGSQKKTWYSISLVSLLFLIVFVAFLAAFSADLDNEPMLMLLFMVIVLIYGSVQWVVFGTIRSMTRESKMELVNKNMAYLKNQLILANENERLAKTIRHDLRHHNQNIAAMLQRGDIQDALRYIEQYDESLAAAKQNAFCPHITVNAILNHFYTQAAVAGIPARVSADTPRESAIADMDYVAILSNLLENALHGCKECRSQGEINVSLRTVADKTVIVCSNPCTPDLVLENSMPKNRGVGLDSMASAASKYGGDISYTLADGILTACVILKH